MSRTVRSFMARTLRSSYCSRSALSVKLSTSMVVAMKLTRNWKLSMERSADTASLVTKDEARMMYPAFSFSESAIRRLSTAFSLFMNSSR